MKNSAEVILIFYKKDDLPFQFKKLLKKKGLERLVILVKPGDIYRCLGQYIYQINPQDKENYNQLFSEIKEKYGKVHYIFHMWNYHISPIDYETHGQFNQLLNSLKINIKYGAIALEHLTSAMKSLDYDNDTELYYFYSNNKNNIQPQNEIVLNWYCHLKENQNKYKFRVLIISDKYNALQKISTLLFKELNINEEQRVTAINYDENGCRNSNLKEISLFIRQRESIPLHRGDVLLVINNSYDDGINLSLEIIKKLKCTVVVVGTQPKEKYTDFIKENTDLIYEQINDFYEIKNILQKIQKNLHKINGIIYFLNDSDQNNDEHNIYEVLSLDNLTIDIPINFYVTIGTNSLYYNLEQDQGIEIHCFADSFMNLRNKLVTNKRRFGINYYLRLETQECDSKKVAIENLIQHFQVSEQRDSTETTIACTKDNLFNLVCEEIIKLTASVLGVVTDKIGMDLSLDLDSPYGLQFNSISLTQLADKISTKFELKISPVIFFKTKTLKSLINYLIARYESKLFEYYQWRFWNNTEHHLSDNSLTTSVLKKNQPSAIEHIDGKEVFANNDVAIIGASGVFPGSPDLTTFWQNIANGKSLITEIPKNRWDWREYSDYKDAVKWGGFIDGIDLFDAEFFGIVEKEAVLMDPQQRLFLETCWKTIEDAGYKASALSGSKTGIFVGVGASEYYELLQLNKVKIEEQSSTAKSNSILANRVSYLFNFTGPSESIDVACASSIVAIHRAVEQIQNGECDLAIAGGVHLILTPNMHISFSKGGVLSPDGKCRSFDKDANGYVRSEGVGAVLLKPLKQAEIDGDHIYAVIKGSAVNHGGRSNSMTSPNPSAQEKVIVTAHQKAAISPLTVNYIEGHGTATNFGDAIEITALNSAFEYLTNKAEISLSKMSCGIGSVKTNLGHTEETAGLAGIFKVILAMKYGKIPGNMHFKEVNPLLEIEKTPFFIVNKTIAWEPIKDNTGSDYPRRAGISSFGFGGVNAHIVLEEYKRSRENLKLDSYLIILSAKSESVLKHYAQSLYDFLNSNDEAGYTLADLAYTLQIGREEMPCRLAVIIKDKTELNRVLLQYINSDEPMPSSLHLGFINDKDIKLEKKNNLKQIPLDEIARLWVKGENIAWQELYYPSKPLRISIPTYPFTRKRFWFSVADKGFPKQQDDILTNFDQISLQNEQETIFKKWNQTHVDYPADKCIYELIEVQCLKNPNNIAACFEGTYLTYQELMQQVDALAAYLCQKGITNNSYVGLFVTRSLDMLITVLAIMKSGNIYIPLDSMLPKDRIDYIIQDTKLNCIILNTENLTNLPSFTDNLIVLDKEWQTIKAQCKNNVSIARQTQEKTSKRVAYIIYTSGSTGKPKGVEIYHRSLTNVLCSMTKKPGFKQQDYLLAVTTLCFDIAGLELYLPLINGGTVEILPEYITKDGVKLREKIENSKATMMQATPATWEMLLSAGWIGKRNFKILCGGELLTESLAEKLLQCADEVWNLYGPTETTIWSTLSRVKRGESINIGHPINNTQVYVLDDKLQYVANSVPGELYLGGDGVAKGYLNRPVLNEKKFIVNPFNQQSEKLYRTGDRVCYQADGTLIYLGRNDSQVKLRGFRIELNEIESLLRILFNFENVVVVLKKETARPDYLVAFYVSKNISQHLTRENILTELQKKLPAYMIPTTFIQLSAFPLTSNLKVDRRQLTEVNIDTIKSLYEVNSTLNNEFSLHNQQNLKSWLQKELTKIIAYIFSMEIQAIDPNKNFGEYGINSILYTTLSMKINESFNININATIFFRYSTANSLIDYLLINHSPQLLDCYNAASKFDCTNYTNNSEDPIAIIGIDGKFPQSNDLLSFWQNLIDNKNLITEIPEQRWNHQPYFGDPTTDVNKTNSKWGGFLANVEFFDAEFFDISPREAELMDPRQRLLMECIWKTFENAGYKPEDFSGSKTGIFIGAINSDYWDLQRLFNVPIDNYSMSGFANSIIANRISYFFNLKGPSSVIDTACSSSLIAIQAAIEAIKNNDCDVAIAGGVNLILSPYLYLALSKNGMLSPEGQCKTFDKFADGYVRGEGVATILLKPLSKAIKDKDHVYAIIKGSAVNHGGKANSLAAPNPEAQTNLLIEAYSAANVDPATITFIETHGTGTKLGDPIEIEALKDAFSFLYKKWHTTIASKKPICGLGAVKTNIGHLEAAAGIAGVLKIILAMRAGMLPANINFNDLNPHINLDDSSFYLINQNKKWQQIKDEQGNNIPRRAGVSSFGFGGSNAHLVIEEGPPQTILSNQAKPYYLVTLSAKHHESLKQKLSDLLAYLQRYSELPLENIAYTLNQGRSHFDYRCAVIAASLTELQEKLAQVVAGDIPTNYFHGKVQQKLEDQAIYKKLVQTILTELPGLIGKNDRQYKDSLEALANLYVKGYVVDWHLLHQGENNHRIPLPTYPFLGERYWLSADVKELSQNPVTIRSLAHPLLGWNASTLEEQCFKTLLHGNEFYLTDHVVQERKLLPGVVYLEAARAAGELAAPGRRVTTLQQIAWLRPLTVDNEPREIALSLYPQERGVIYELYTEEQDSRVIYGQGELVFGSNQSEPVAWQNLSDLLPTFNYQLTSQELYAQFKEIGLNYGACFQSLQWVKTDGQTALGFFQLPNSCKREEDFYLHPSLMDAVLQTVMCISQPQENRKFLLLLPFALETLLLCQPLPDKGYAYVRPTANTNLSSLCYDIQVWNEKGDVCLELTRLQARPFQRTLIEEEAQLQYYVPYWKEQLLLPTPSFATAENSLKGILLVSDDNYLMTELRQQLTAPVIQLKSGSNFRAVDDKTYEIRLGETEDYEQVLKAVQTADFSISHIILARTWQSTTPENQEENIDYSFKSELAECVTLFQVLLRHKIAHSMQILGLYSITPSDAQRIFGVMLASFSKSLFAEQPQYKLRVIGMDNLRVMEIKTELLTNGNAEPHVRYQEAHRYVEQFEAMTIGSTAKQIWRQHGIYLITGGLGGIGFMVAKYLATNYQAKLVLTGRSPLDATKQQQLATLSELGAEVLYLTGDVADVAVVQDWLEQTKRRFGTLQGIIHAAGVLHDKLLVNKSWQEFTAVMAPKVQGALNLDAVTKTDALDCFILFSSLISAIGNVGQTDYASANAFLDGFAMWRAEQVKRGQRSGKTVTINWPLWAEGGMKVDAPTQQYLENRFGLRAIPSDVGLSALTACLEQPHAQCLVAYGSASVFARTLEQPTQRVTEAVTPINPASQPTVKSDVLFYRTQEYLKQHIATTLKLPLEKLGVDVSFERYGLDSVVVMSLIRVLEQDFGVLPKTLFFEYHTVSELAKYFVEHHSEILQKRWAVAAVDKQTTVASSLSLPSIPSRFMASISKQKSIEAHEDIAIIGLSGRYPMARTIEQFWENLALGKDCVSEIPKERWDYSAYYDAGKEKVGKVYGKWGGFIDDYDKFDPLFFNISPREAELLDPQERLFLEVAWEVFEDAGYTLERLKKQRQTNNTPAVGVFVGVMYGLYQLYGSEESVQGHPIAFNSSYSSIANRVSYCFDLQGPSMAIDTMCSSSLTALHLACESIRRGECQLALAGGVNITAHFNKYFLLSQGRFLASDGKCKSFGEGGDGYVPGEGVGGVLLKPLSQAIKEGDRIYGVIKGSSINHGGHTNGYTVPNPNAQAELIKDAFKQAQIAPESISYVEAHGTGTSLGDPIEIRGLCKAWGEGIDQKCAIGSVKSNIGHLESAAGIAALTKVLLQMQHKQLVPSIHSEILNEHIDFSQTPFEVQRKLSEWKPIDNYPRRAGISSFGAGGSNAHVIVEEGPAYVLSTKQQKPYYLVTLSARHRDSLENRIEELLTWLSKYAETPLEAIAYSLNKGRSHFNYRFAVVVNSTEELHAKLASYQKDGKVTWSFIGDSNQPLTDAAIYEQVLQAMLEKIKGHQHREEGEYGKQLAALGNLYVKGYEIDWDIVHAEEAHQVVSLPTYPFLRERYWVPQKEYLASNNLANSAIHPLLGWNNSTLLIGQSFKTLFKGNEFYLRDHVIAGKKVLPGVAYLEMAKVAAEYSVPNNEVCALCNVIWQQPITVEESDLEISINLEPFAEGINYSVYSETAENEIFHSQGNILYGDKIHVTAWLATLVQGNEEITSDKITKLSEHLTHQYKKEDLYAYYEQTNLHYGKSFQVLDWVKTNGKEILGYYRLPDDVDTKQYSLHPSILDGVLQAGAMLNKKEETNLVYVPFALEKLTLGQAAIANEGYVHIRREPDTELQLEFQLLDKKGNVCLQGDGLSLRPVIEKSTIKTLEYYSPQWVPSPLSVADNKLLPSAQSLCIFSENKELVAQIRARLTNIPVLHLYSGSLYENTDDYNYQITQKDVDGYRNFIRDIQNRNINLSHFILGGNFNTTDVSHFIDTSLHEIMLFIQALIQAKISNQIKILVPYQFDPMALASEMMLSGFAKSLHLEHPRYQMYLVGFNKQPSLDFQVEKLLFELANGSNFHVRYQADERIVENYLPQKKNVTNTDEVVSPMLRNEGIYLITGGLGGLGFIFAEYLAKNYRAKLILTGVSGLTAVKHEKINRLEALGASVIYLSGNISEQSIVEQAIMMAKTHFGELNGIIHSAGIIEDRLLLQKEWLDFKNVLAPKVQGILNLDQATKEENLDFFVVFSSMASCFGNVGQTDYATANAFLDEFARWRERQRQCGQRYGKTLSFNWPYWLDGGMKGGDVSEQALINKWGLLPLPSKEGLLAFVECLKLPVLSQCLVIYGKQKNFEAIIDRINQPNFNSDQKEKLILNSAGSQLIEAKNEILTSLKSDLIATVAKILKLPLEAVDIFENLSHFGFDSITFTELANQFNTTYEFSLTPAIFFEYTSLDAFAEYLWRTQAEKLRSHYYPSPLKDDSSLNKPSQFKTNRKIHFLRQQETKNSLNKEPIAIVGAAGIFPQSENLEKFWLNLLAGKDMITSIPAERWQWQDLISEKEDSGLKWGAFVPEIDKFDPAFFGISAREACLMDPQHRIFLEVVWKTIENAGYCPLDFSGTKMGLYVGVANNDYMHLLHDIKVEAHTSTGNAHSILANRISYLLNFRGPSEPVDTACSSSLVAVYKAIDALWQGECDFAIAGGINILITPEMYLSFNDAGMLSPDGRCKTFDEKANGYVRGEGAGAILLMPLSRAEKEKTPIYGLIKGGALNHGGRTNSLTAPSPIAQKELLVSAYQKTGIDPTTVTYIEAHGTGTKLGDPIEINALKLAFEELYQQHEKTSFTQKHCGIGAIKSNIGHLETAAGIAGLLKVVLAMKYKIIPGNIHFKQLNPYIQLNDSPFYILDQNRVWTNLKDDEGNSIPLRAGVSSFGFGGVNAHIVLEEYSNKGIMHDQNNEEFKIALFSAENKPTLHSYLNAIHEFLKSPLQKIDREFGLEDLAFTLQTGRLALKERIVFIVKTIDELAEKMAYYLHDEKDKLTNCFEGTVQRSQSFYNINKRSYEKNIYSSLSNSYENLLKISNQWVKGEEINWLNFYNKQQLPNKISIPPYPFSKQRYWFTDLPEVKEQKADKENLIIPKNIKMIAGVNNEMAQESCEPIVVDQIQNILSRILSINSSDVSLDINFHDMGLDSIMTMKFVKELNNTFNILLNPQYVFENPTVHKLADFLRHENMDFSSVEIQNSIA